jgi:hypothetical protein
MCKAWRALVPEQFVDITCPLRLISASSALQGRAVADVLLVGVHSNVVGSQFYYFKNDVISKVATYFGQSIICDIKVVLRQHIASHSYVRTLYDENEFLADDASARNAVLDIDDAELKRNLLQYRRFVIQKPHA